MAAQAGGDVDILRWRWTERWRRARIEHGARQQGVVWHAPKMAHVPDPHRAWVTGVRGPDDERVTSPHIRGSVNRTPSGVALGRPARLINSASILRLQRSAGNAVVRELLVNRDLVAGDRHPVQREEKKQLSGAGIRVHPKSGLSAAQLLKLLKNNKHFPNYLKKGLASKGGALVLAGKLPKARKDRIVDFIEPFLAAFTSPAWEITTAESKMAVKGSGQTGPTFSQLVVPKLSEKEHLGTLAKTGPGGQTGVVALPLYSDEKEVIFGWTVPPDSVQLKSRRGLIVIVTKITVTAPDGRSRVFTPTEDVIVEAITHEIAAHAGRISQGEKDTHGDPDVEDITEQVAEFFQKAKVTTTGGLVRSKTAAEIFDFVGAAASPTGAGRGPVKVKP